MNWTEERKRRARRRLARRGSIAVLLMLAAFTLIGITLGPEQAVSARALLERPPETIWRVLLDLDGMPLWRSDLRAVERLPDQDGRPAWKETSAAGTRIMEVASAEPPNRLVLRRAQPKGLPMRIVELTPAGRGTLVTVSERRRVGNPLLRVYDRLLPPRATVVRFLRDLRQRLATGRREVVSNPGR